MGLLNEKERSDFIWGLRSKKTDELKVLFNELTAASKDSAQSDYSRGKASEKAAIVRTHIELHNTGGNLG